MTTKRSPKKRLDDLLAKYSGTRPGAGPRLGKEAQAFQGEPPTVRRAGEPKKEQQ